MESNQCQGCEKSAAGRILLSSCKNLFGLAVENAPLGIAVVKEGEMLYSNPACAQILGYDGHSEVVGTKILDYVTSECQGEVISFIRNIRENGLSMAPGSFFETVVAKKDGSTIHLRIRLAWVETQCCGSITLCYITDVSEQKKLQAQLRDQAISDPLTDLFNRRYMEETLHREMSRAHRQGTNLGVMMLDLDHFKKFNDTYGHAGGDELLRAFAQLLKNNVREEDAVCRYGGEEFLIIMPGASAETVKTRAELIRQETAELKIYHEKQILSSTTVSVGVAFFPEHGNREEMLIATADLALYRAKEQGRNRVVVAKS